MEFKIDTNKPYLHILVQSERIHDKMAATILQTLKQYPDDAAAKDRNVIFDLKNCHRADPGITAELIKIHEFQYERNQSFVITQAKGEVLSLIRNEDKEETLQLAPSFQEALDIIHMEILERDLLGEE